VAGSATRVGAATLPTAFGADGVVTPGPVMAIGGAEDKLRDKLILSAFVNLAGGPEARIAILPTASSIEEAGERYKALFMGMGAERADVLYLSDRAAAASPDVLEILDDVTGVFLTGGNQMRLASIVGGTPVARKVRALNQAGAAVAGTSAGASILSSHMVAYGASGPSPRMRMAQMTAGFGLVPGVVIDQHFRQRDRLGRLLTALAYNPFAIGLGLDEDTAAFFGPDDRLEVVGSGAITVVDPSQLVHSSMDAARHGEPVSLIGIRLHILVNGDLLDAETREARPGAARG
jgi:cyanophycinase